MANPIFATPGSPVSVGAISAARFMKPPTSVAVGVESCERQYPPTTSTPAFSLTNESFVSGVEALWQSVKFTMIAGRHYLQVFYSVIKSIPVLMMNYLVGKRFEPTAQVLFHHGTMLVNPLTTYFNQYVPATNSHLLKNSKLAYKLQGGLL